MNCWSNRNYSSRKDRHCIIIFLRKNNYLFVDCVTHPYFLLKGFIVFFLCLVVFYQPKIPLLLCIPSFLKKQTYICKFCHCEPTIISFYPEKGEKPWRCPDELHSCRLLRGITPKNVCTNIYRKWRSSPWSLLISNNTDINSTEHILLRQ